MADWFPGAIQKLGNDAGSFVAGYTKRGVLHKTEGGIAGSLASYKTNNSWPHFTVGKDGKVYQHLSISKAARSLENMPGGVETNRAGAIQIEIEGFSADPSWMSLQLESMRSLMRWIEAQTGIQPTGPAFGGSGQYGLRNPLEFTNEQWKTFNGWCGHQHVPENRHWDPGAINLNDLLPVVVPPIIVPPSQEIQLDVNIQIVNVKILTDGGGSGWTKVPHQIDKIIGFLPPGLRPGADGRYLTGEVSFAQEDPNTIVSLTEWDPNAETIVRLRVAV